MEYNINKLIESANKLGIKVAFNSESPGIHSVDKEGNKRVIEIEDVFPELKEVD